MMQTLTEPEYRNAIREKYGEVLKSCRNLVTQEDIRQVRRAFDIALKNETSAEKLNYREILRIIWIDACCFYYYFLFCGNYFHSDAKL